MFINHKIQPKIIITMIIVGLYSGFKKDRPFILKTNIVSSIASAYIYRCVFYGQNKDLSYTDYLSNNKITPDVIYKLGN
jgi:phage terminase large subunit